MQVWARCSLLSLICTLLLNTVATIEVCVAVAAVENPAEMKEDGMLLSDEFTEEMMELYSPVRHKQVPDSKPVMPQPSKSFPVKLLNIMDPLLPNNNLGRSVSKASFARIRKALSHGAKTLTDIMAKVHWCLPSPANFSGCTCCTCRQYHTIVCRHIIFCQVTPLSCFLRLCMLTNALPSHQNIR